MSAKAFFRKPSIFFKFFAMGELCIYESSMTRRWTFVLSIWRFYSERWELKKVQLWVNSCPCPCQSQWRRRDKYHKHQASHLKCTSAEHQQQWRRNMPIYCIWCFLSWTHIWLPIAFPSSRASSLPCTDIFTEIAYHCNKAQPKHLTWKKHCTSKALSAGCFQRSAWCFQLGKNASAGLRPQTYFFFFTQASTKITSSVVNRFGDVLAPCLLLEDSIGWNTRKLRPSRVQDLHDVNEHSNTQGGYFDVNSEIMAELL